MKAKIIFIVLIAWLSAITLQAQEEQVPVDQEGKIMRIDTELEKELDLFPEYSGLKEASLFRSPDSSYVLEIVYQPENKIMKAKKHLSHQEVQKFREKVTMAIRKQVPAEYLDQNGRTRLILNSGLVSLGYYGWAVPSMLGVDDGKVFTGLYMLTSGAGVFLPMAVTKDRQVTDADAALSDYGMKRGIAVGMLLNLLVDEDPGIKPLLGSGIVGSIAGGIGGYYLSEKHQINAGEASLIRAMGDFGVIAGVGTSHTLGLYDNTTARKVLSSMLISWGGGMAAGAFLNHKQSYSKGDALLLRGAGGLGLQMGLTAVNLVNPHEPKWYSAIGTLSTVGGLAIGHRITKNVDFSTNQGAFILLSEIAGGLFGLGTGYLISSENNNNAYKTWITLSALGSAAGFSLMTISSFNQNGNTGDGSSTDYSFDFNLNPWGLLGMTGKDETNHQTSPGEMPTPLLSAQLRF